MSEPTNATSTFKFASSVTVLQATSKCSKKYDLYGKYGLWLEESSKNPLAKWLDPAKLLSSYKLENMSKLIFKVRPDATYKTTPNDDLGEGASRQWRL